MPCRTLQLCCINNNWPISVHRIFATKFHRTERCSNRQRSCATRHVTFVMLSCDKVARQNRAKKIAGVTSVLKSTFEAPRKNDIGSIASANTGGCPARNIRISLQPNHATHRRAEWRLSRIVATCDATAPSSWVELSPPHLLVSEYTTFEHSRSVVIWIRHIQLSTTLRVAWVREIGSGR